MKKNIFIILSLLFIVAIAYVAWTYYKSEKNPVVSASPLSGTAPLTVNFSVSATDSSESSGIYYTIVFGDESASPFPQTSKLTTSHTYTTPGSYEAVIIRNEKCSSWECMGPSTDIGHVVITVNGTATSNPTKTSSPSLTITSPKGGHIIKNGEDAITITWQSNNIPTNQTIDVIRLTSLANGQEYNIATNVTNDGSEVIPLTSIPSGSYTLEMKMHVDGNPVMSFLNGTILIPQSFK